MKRIYFLPIFLLFMGLFKQYSAQAQCPTSLTLGTTANAPATCPANGSIQITSNAPLGSLTYTITAGPAGFNTVPQSDSNFHSLAAGTYTVSASCGGVTQTVNFTIDDNYSPISIDSVKATPTTCNTGSDGTISIFESGGSLPMQYSVVLQGQPDNYQPASVSRTATYTGLDTGTYTIKVKDACGVVVVQTEQVTSAELPVVNAQFSQNTPASCSVTTQTITFNGLLSYANNSGVGNITPYLGNIIVKIYDGTSASAPLLTTFTVTSVSQTFTFPKSSSASVYVVTILSPCNDSLGRLWNNAFPKPAINFNTLSSGCDGTPQGGIFSLHLSGANSNLTFPLTVNVIDPVTGLNISGFPRTYTSINFDGNNTISGIDTGTYKLVITDPCMDTVNLQTISMSASTGATPSLISNFSLQCVSQPGYVRIQFSLNNGSYLPGSSDPTTVFVIVSGPTGVGDTLTVSNGLSTPAYLLPGNYQVAVVTPCVTDTLPVTVSSSNLLVANVTATATSFCGSGGSVSIASTNYNGNGGVSYVLYNTATGAAVPYDNNPADTLGNNSTVWANLPADNYQIAMVVKGYCNASLGSSYTIYSNTVTITDAAGPQIIRKFGLNCAATNTGMAFLDLAGVAPFTLRYVEVGKTDTLALSNVPTGLTVLSNLDTSTIYNLYLTDNCGNTTVSQVAISHLGKIGVTNTVQPCVGSPYTLSVPDYAGATYSWTNQGGAVVSTTSDYQITNYDASYDGTYTCTITFGTCASATTSTTLSSDLCGQLLPITLGAFSAVNSNGTALLKWNTLTEINNKGFGIQRSTDAKSWSDIGFVNSKAANGNSTSNINYTFTDNNPANGINYYRLKQEDLSGGAVYSQVKSVDFGVKATIYPNPTSSQLNVSVAGNSSYQLINAAGSTVLTGAFSTGNNVLNVGGIAAGTYLLRISSGSSATVYKVIKK